MLLETIFKGRKIIMKLWSNSSIVTSAGFNPEKRLLAAVLQRAITDYVVGEGELQESAAQWLYGSEENNSAFGFSFICEALDFHKDELRKAILKQHQIAQNFGGLKKNLENSLDFI
ncbi:MAG: hypothetical protein LBE20_00175 [Deltaproteobacteria bacterium]|nr:hypothetical protein [Deltaproteobacteria bacterium]